MGAQFPRQPARPKLTIGIPVYNGEPLIETALDGIVNQTYRNFVLIVSDNASTDNTWEILQRWQQKDQRIQLCRQSKNIGPMANFRFLLDRAETEYFMWHSHDDFACADYVERLCGILDKDQHCMNAAAKTTRTLADGSTVSIAHFPDLSSKFRFSRVNSIIKNVSPSWIYGIFRTDHLRFAYGLSEEYGYIWGGDRIALLPGMLNDQVRGTNDVYLRCLVTTISQDSYAPKKLTSRLEYARKTMTDNYRILSNSQLTLFEKILVFPYFYYNAATTRGYGKTLLKTYRKLITYNLRSWLGER